MSINESKMERIITVAVDGPAGSGKSSVCKNIALNKQFRYIDSGALYRSITWFFIENKIDIIEGKDVSEFLHNIELMQHFNSDGTATSFVNGQDVSASIRDEIIVQKIGSVSDKIEVRKYVNDILRAWATTESVIMDGRDIGTVVFPNANLKIYLDASVDIRASRRINEYREMGKNVDEKSIKKQIILRDEQDRSRKYGALVKADDALYCDTSSMTQIEVVAYITEIIDRKLKTI